ncbi:COesterase domain-containing protein [Favolaschia claudopus]|uniref:COesterase domain-containing protein n=1 Tax=Favolaschia claudopus TaxID=2862362 RepID=A0AAW0B1K6_9AGAR
MIIDEKVLNPPPPYTKSHSPAPTTSGRWRTLSSLPPHLLLQIVYATFSDAYDIDDAIEQRKTLYWLTIGLRLVNRVFYTTSMNVLRSIYLPLYTSLIRAPYSSDPFPFSSSSSPGSRITPLQTLQRETPILDLFIALKALDDHHTDDSALHLSRAEPIFAHDLFALMQPRARLEDLVREYGIAEGVIYLDTQSNFHSRSSSRESQAPQTSVVLRSAASYAALTQRVLASARSSSSSSSSTFWRPFARTKSIALKHPSTPLPSQKVSIRPLPFSALSIAFSPRRVKLILVSGSGPSSPSSASPYTYTSTSPFSSAAAPQTSQRTAKTIIDVPRTREEPLEVAARRVVWELKDWLVEDADAQCE